MDWIKIPIDNILYSEFTNAETFTLIRYQALYCQLETEPSDVQLNRLFSKKELKFLKSYSEVAQELINSQVKKVFLKRHKEKERYKSKQSVSKKPACRKSAEQEQSMRADKIRLDKIREDKKKSIKEKISLNELSIEHIQDWLAKKRVGGKYLTIDEYALLEKFKDYCSANGRRYKDYVAAFRNSFEWNNTPIINHVKQTASKGNADEELRQFLARK